LIPVKKITEKVKRIFESEVVRLLRKKNNVFRNARRRESARLLTSYRDLDKKIRKMSFRKQKNKIRVAGNQKSL
jgi:hypothetical protein